MPTSSSQFPPQYAILTQTVLDIAGHYNCQVSGFHCIYSIVNLDVPAIFAACPAEIRNTPPCFVCSLLGMPSVLGPVPTLPPFCEQLPPPIQHYPVQFMEKSTHISDWYLSPLFCSLPLSLSYCEFMFCLQSYSYRSFTQPSHTSEHACPWSNIILPILFIISTDPSFTIIFVDTVPSGTFDSLATLATYLSFPHPRTVDLTVGLDWVLSFIVAKVLADTLHTSE